MDDKEAKETLKTMKENIDKKYLKTRNSVAIETLLNLLENQKAEIEKKDKRLNRQFKLLQKRDKEIEKKNKIIDLMIKVMIDSGICDYFIKQNCKHYAGENKKLCDVCIKEYFEKKAEEENKYVKNKRY